MLNTSAGESDSDTQVLLLLQNNAALINQIIKTIPGFDALHKLYERIVGLSTNSYFIRDFLHKRFHCFSTQKEAVDPLDLRCHLFALNTLMTRIGMPPTLVITVDATNITAIQARVQEILGTTYVNQDRAITFHKTKSMTYGEIFDRSDGEFIADLNGIGRPLIADGDNRNPREQLVKNIFDAAINAEDRDPFATCQLRLLLNATQALVDCLKTSLNRFWHHYRQADSAIYLIRMRWAPHHGIEIKSELNADTPGTDKAPVSPHKITLNIAAIHTMSGDLNQSESSSNNLTNNKQGILGLIDTNSRVWGELSPLATERIEQRFQGLDDIRISSLKMIADYRNSGNTESRGSWIVMQNSGSLDTNDASIQIALAKNLAEVSIPQSSQLDVNQRTVLGNLLVINHDVTKYIQDHLADTNWLALRQLSGRIAKDMQVIIKALQPEKEKPLRAVESSPALSTILGNALSTVFTPRNQTGNSPARARAPQPLDSPTRGTPKLPSAPNSPKQPTTRQSRSESNPVLPPGFDPSGKLAPKLPSAPASPKQPASPKLKGDNG